MNRIIGLAIAAMLAITALPAAAEGKPTEAQFIYRYTAILSIAGVDLGSKAAPKTGDERTDGKRVTTFDNCLIMVDPDDCIVDYAIIWFPDEMDSQRSAAFMLALDNGFYFDKDTDVSPIEIHMTVAKIITTNDVDYCGYEMHYTKYEGMPMLVAGVEID